MPPKHRSNAMPPSAAKTPASTARPARRRSTNRVALLIAIENAAVPPTAATNETQITLHRALVSISCEASICGSGLRGARGRRPPLHPAPECDGGHGQDCDANDQWAERARPEDPRDPINRGADRTR